MAESKKLSLLLTRQRYIITGTEEQVMCMEAGTKEQVSEHSSQEGEGGGGRTITTITIYFIHRSRKLKLLFDRTTKNIVILSHETHTHTHS